MFLRSQQSLELKGGNAVKLEGAGTCDVKGAAVSVNSTGNLQLKASAKLEQTGALITIN